MKKLLATLLIGAMVITTADAPVLARDAVIYDDVLNAEDGLETNDDRDKINNPRDEKGVTVWDCVYFGNYCQRDKNNDGIINIDDKEPIKWRVLSVNEDDAFLLSDQNLDFGQYNFSYSNVTWENCTMRSWLNGYDSSKNKDKKDYVGIGFIDNAFNLEERSAIFDTYVANNVPYDTPSVGGNDTVDKIYFLSFEEVKNSKYGFSSDYTKKDKARQSKNTELAKRNGAYTDTSPDLRGNGYWWLRSSGDYNHGGQFVGFNGIVNHGGNPGNSTEKAFRPVLHLDLSSPYWKYAGKVYSDVISEEIESVINGKGRGSYSFRLTDNSENILKNRKIKYYFSDKNNKTLPGTYTSISNEDGFVTIRTKEYDNTAGGVTASPITDRIEAHISYYSEDGVSTTDITAHNLVFNITVNPVSFIQNWSLSSKASVEASIGPQAGVAVGPLEAEAAVAKASATYEQGTTFNIKNEYDAGKRNFALAQEFNKNIGVNGSIGPKAEANAGVHFDGKLAEANAGLKLGALTRLTKEFNNYIPSAANTKEIGKFLLATEATAGGNELLMAVVLLIAPDVFDKVAAGGTLSADAGASILGGEINNGKNNGEETNFISGSVANVEYNSAFSAEIEASKNGGKITKNMSKVSGLNVSALSAGGEYEIPIPGNNTLGADFEIGVFNSTFLPKNYSLSATPADKKFEIRELSGLGVTKKENKFSDNLFYAKSSLYDADREAYDVLEYNGDNFDKICEKVPNINRFANGNSMYFFDSAFSDTNSFFQHSGIDADYRKDYSESSNWSSRPLGLGAALEVGLDGRIRFSGTSKETHVLESGMYTSYRTDNDDIEGIVIPTAVNNCQEAIDNNTVSITELLGDDFSAVIDEAKSVLKSKMAEFGHKVVNGFCEVISEIGDGFDRLICIVTVNNSATSDSKKVANIDSLTSYVIRTEESFWQFTQSVDGDGIEEIGDRMTGTAVTIGESYYITEMEADGVTAVNSFEDAPIDIKLSFADEMLTAAGVPLDKKSSIEMFRYDEEKRGYISVGGEVDTENNSVTVKEVTKSGQYVLAINKEALPDEYPEHEKPSKPEGFNFDPIENITYSGQQIKPEPQIYWGDIKLEKGIDYTITYKNNVNAYTLSENDEGFNATKAPAIIINGKGNYAGTETVYFKITPLSINSNNMLLGDISTVIEGNTPYKPVPKLTYNKKSLKSGKDFNVKYYQDMECKNEVIPKAAGTYYAKIIGINNFTGDIVENFAIGSKDSVPISKLAINKILPKKYTGSEIILNSDELVIKDGKGAKEIELKADKNYKILGYKNNVEIGTASVRIKGIDGKYIGTRTITFNIEGTSVKNVTVEGIDASLVYTGNEIRQTKLKITDSLTGKAIRFIDAKEYAKLSDTDKKRYGMIITYANNINAGNASLVITGVSEYVGSIKKTFKIAPYNIASEEKDRVKVNLDATKYEYSKAGSKPVPVVTFNGRTLVNGKDYTVSYLNNKDITLTNTAANKMPSVKITGKGNFIGTDSSATFEIKAKNISVSENGVKFSVKDIAYANKAGNWKSSLSLTDEGKKLVVNKDYDKEIVYTYESIPLDSKVMDGSKKPVEAVARKSGDIVEDKDIVPAGTVIKANIKAAKTDNCCYTGTVSTSYRIVEKDIKSFNIKVNPKTYTGKAVTLSNDDIIFIQKGKTVKDVTFDIIENTYTKNVNKGQATVVIKGNGNYGGEKTVSYTIGARSLLWWWRK